MTFARATQSVIYAPEQTIEGMEMYPIADFVWNRKYNSCRGYGEVMSIIPNQIAVNRLLLRREVNNKQTGYAHPVYHTDYIEDPESLDRVGSKVAISGGAMVQDVAKAFTYIQPAPMSPDGANLQNEIIETTRNLANASDEATGNVDPTQASGKAISLVIDQNAVMLTEQQSAYKQFVEDIALIWYDIWKVYNPNGMTFAIDTDNGIRDDVTIDPVALQTMDVRVRVDVSSNNPWSVYANDQEAMNLFGNGFISFDRYVQLLSDQNHMKPKLEQFVKEDQAQAMQQQAMQEQMMMQQQMMGGMNNGMQTMPNPYENPVG